MLEKDIENKFRLWIEARGEYCFKINPLGRVGWPDRIVFGKDRLIFFIEFKRPGEKARKIQRYIHRKIMELGFNVYICESVEEAKACYWDERGQAA